MQDGSLLRPVCVRTSGENAEANMCGWASCRSPKRMGARCSRTSTAWLACESREHRCCRWLAALHRTTAQLQVSLPWWRLS